MAKPVGLLDAAMMRTTREPPRDVRAQVRAVANPASAKQAAFVAKGTAVPKKLPPGLAKVTRPAGTLVTNSPAHAAAFARAPLVTPSTLAPLLGYPESKGAAIARAGGKPVVVQGRAPSGAVAHESVASPGPGVLAAALSAKAAVPGGKVVVTTPEAVQARRKGKRQ